MFELNNPETTVWVVSHNNEDIFIGTEVTPSNHYMSGQPYYAVFDSLSSAQLSYPQAWHSSLTQQEPV